jgi:hypothetical protein
MVPWEDDPGVQLGVQLGVQPAVQVAQIQRPDRAA